MKDGANTDTLKKITECVVQLDTADSATIKAFFIVNYEL